MQQFDMQDEKKLRKRLLQWHYNKSRTIAIIDLLESGYQLFRRRVAESVGNTDIDFRDAIKQADYKQLQYLQNFLNEERAEKMMKRKR